MNFRSMTQASKPVAAWVGYPSDGASHCGVVHKAPLGHSPIRSQKAAPKLLRWAVTEPTTDDPGVAFLTIAASMMDDFRQIERAVSKSANSAIKRGHSRGGRSTRHAFGNGQSPGDVSGARNQGAQRWNRHANTVLGSDHAFSRLCEGFVLNQLRPYRRHCCFVLKALARPSQVLMSVGDKEQRHLHLLNFLTPPVARLSPCQPPSQPDRDGCADGLSPSRSGLAHREFLNGRPNVHCKVRVQSKLQAAITLVRMS